jgi:hypothetical protein
LSGTYTDVTARRATETALRPERDRAESAARATSEFPANMSHELQHRHAIIGVSDSQSSAAANRLRSSAILWKCSDAGQGLLTISDIPTFKD